ncbi:MAG: transposase [Pirellulales bacterium]|nr:transposase [Pirellulales bacterium]
MARFDGVRSLRTQAVCCSVRWDRGKALADRVSAHTMRANQLRLWFSSVAYTLLQVIRQVGLQGTKLSHTRCDTDFRNYRPSDSPKVHLKKVLTLHGVERTRQTRKNSPLLWFTNRLWGLSPLHHRLPGIPRFLQTP